MTPEHIELVKSTVPVLRENGVALTSYFYNRMLNNNPELKNIFNLDSQNSGRQPRALAAAVLAYAENIENPSVLAKAIENITTKHVSLDIRPDQYAIVGENLLHSISEVLNVPFESELIAAWKVAYLQLADILIGVEKQKYHDLSAQTGGWSGWRDFEISQIETSPVGKVFTVKASDAQAISNATPDHFISVKVKVPNQPLEQPQQFVLSATSDHHYQFEVKPVENRTEFSVANILFDHYNIGDQISLTAPLAK